MKAILVIGLDDEWYDRLNTTCDEMLADITVYKKESLEHQCDYTQRIYRCWCPLKPLPQHKLTNLDTSTDYSCGWEQGYNACIDELVGDEE